uniref:Uncharacterized protein n=1 Tax=Arundo donax TaxID=35708 RepID=A0A0A9F4W7_ARUDO
MLQIEFVDGYNWVLSLVK